MTRRLLGATAAAVMLLSGSALAQNEQGGEQIIPPGVEAGGSGAEQSGSANVQPADQEAAGSDAVPTAPGGANDAAQPAGEVVPPAAEAGGTATSNTGDADVQPADKVEAGADAQPGADNQTDAAAEDAIKDDTKSAEGKDTGDDAKTAASEGDADITTEQRTTIRETIVEQKVEPVADIDFTISIGTAIPQTIVLNPLPPRIVEIVPAYRTYRYFVLADGTIVIVNPDSYAIVYVIEA